MHRQRFETLDRLLDERAWKHRFQNLSQRFQLATVVRLRPLRARSTLKTGELPLPHVLAATAGHRVRGQPLLQWMPANRTIFLPHKISFRLGRKPLYVVFGVELDLTYSYSLRYRPSASFSTYLPLLVPKLFNFFGDAG